MKKILVSTLCLLVLFMSGCSFNVNVNNTNSDDSNKSINNQNNNSFTELFKYNLQEIKEVNVTVNSKELIFRNDNGSIYFNGKIINNATPIIYVTNNIILFESEPSQVGSNYLVYDLDGNEIKKTFKEQSQFYGLKVKNGKLYVSVFNENKWMEGYIIGNLNTEPEDSKNCSKKLSDYPSVIEEHKNDILEADYYFEFSNNELSLKIDKVLLTVEEFAEKNPNVCVFTD